MKTPSMRVGEFLEPARTGAVGGGGGQQRVPVGILLVEPDADHRAVGQHEIALHQHRDAAQRREAGEGIIAVEGGDRVDRVDEALQRHAGEHLAHLGADEAADDEDVLGPRPARSFRRTVSHAPCRLGPCRARAQFPRKRGSTPPCPPCSLGLFG